MRGNMFSYKMSDCSKYEKDILVLGDDVKSDAFHIAFAINDKFAMGMGVCIQSIVENSGNEFVIHILTLGLSMENLNLIENITALTGVQIIVHVLRRDFMDEFPATDRYPLEVYHRLLLPKILYGKLDMVLYLDADTLCINDFPELKKLKLNDKIAAVITDVSEREDRMLWLRSIGYKNLKYFNSGVIFININKWEDEKVTENAIKFINEYSSDLIFFDQDALNAVLEDKVIWLDKKYNLLNSMHKSNYDEVLKKAVIVHYGGDEPLWAEWCENPFQKQFLEYKKNSAWMNTPLLLPKTTLQMRKNSRKCIKDGHWLLGIYWYIRYIVKKVI